MERSSSHKIKVTIIGVLLLLESLILTLALSEYASVGDFTPNIDVFVRIGLLMLLLSYTHSMFIGAWGGWEQYIIVPGSISLGIFLALMPLDVVHARNVSLISGLLLLYFNMRSISLKSVFVKFSPAFVLKRVTAGTLFVFSVVCASIVLVNPEGGHVANLERNVTDSVISLAEKFAIMDLSSKNLSESAIVNLDIKKQLQKEVNKTIDPYRKAIAPVMAFLVFTIIQAVGTTTFILYILTIRPLFFLATKLKFIKISTVTVEQEIPSF